LLAASTQAILDVEVNALSDLLSTSIDSVIRAASQLVAVVAAVVALVTYRKTARTKRAEWLASLHTKFFESTNYKRIRGILDYQTPELATLRELVSSGEYNELAELFADYLNFFEFIASLWKLGQLDIGEVAMLFEYYLNNLATHKFITNFITTHGFENLNRLLAELARRKAVTS
jgi:hypothetical protein